MDASTPPETERLLMAANLHRLRGELREAETMVRAALERNPSDAFAQEFLGDLLAQRGDTAGAEAAYRAVLQDSPGRAAVEEKLARLILKTHPVGAMTATGSTLRTDRNPMTVAIFSLMFPGFGHYYLGDKVKGLIFGAVGIMLLFGMVPALFELFGSVAGAVSSVTDPEGDGAVRSTGGVSGVGQLLLWGLLFTGLQLYAVYDAYTTAKNVYRPG